MTREFSVLLTDSGYWDVFLDGQREHFDLDDSGLLDFAQRFRADNQPGPTYAPDSLAPATAGDDQ